MNKIPRYVVQNRFGPYLQTFVSKAQAVSSRCPDAGTCHFSLRILQRKISGTVNCYSWRDKMLPKTAKYINKYTKNGGCDMPPPLQNGKRLVSRPCSRSKMQTQKHRAQRLNACAGHINLLPLASWTSRAYQHHDCNPWAAPPFVQRCYTWLLQKYVNCRTCFAAKGMKRTPTGVCHHSVCRWWYDMQRTQLARPTNKNKSELLLQPAENLQHILSLMFVSKILRKKQNNIQHARLQHYRWR